MIHPVDTACFQLQAEADDDEALLIAELCDDARAYVQSRPWAHLVAEIMLAYAVGDILGLFLLRLSEDFPAIDGAIEGDRERWVVVGDLPYMNFETEDFDTPELALELYCAIAKDWADAVLTGRDLSESYPIPVAPTEESARMLLSRVQFIRDEIIPSCRTQCMELAASDKG